MQSEAVADDRHLSQVSHLFVEEKGKERQIKKDHGAVDKSLE